MALRFRLDALLAESGISQRQLAIKSGVSPTAVNLMANNKMAQVAFHTLERLAKALSTSKRKVRPLELLADE